MGDIVRNPNHYTREAATLEPMDMTWFLPHPIASSLEYILRAGKKEGVPEEVDLKKAVFWLESFMQRIRLIEHRIWTLDFGQLMILEAFAKRHEVVREALDAYESVRLFPGNRPWVLMAEALHRHAISRLEALANADKQEAA